MTWKQWGDSEYNANGEVFVNSVNSTTIYNEEKTYKLVLEGVDVRGGEKVLPLAYTWVAVS